MSTIFISIHTYQHCVHKRNEEISITHRKLSIAINEIFNESQSLLTFLGKKIQENYTYHNLEPIVSILKNTDSLRIKSMLNSYISWATNNGKIIIGKGGIITEVLPDISSRAYYKHAKNSPWTLQLSEITKSSFTKSDILPMAMGITNKENVFIGYLIFSLKIDSINDYLSVLSANHLHFLLLDDNKNIIFKSTNHNIDLKTLLNYMTDNEISENPFTLDSTEYLSIKRLEPYSYTLLIGIDKSSFLQDFFHQVYPKLIELLIIGFLFLILLIIVQKILHKQKKTEKLEMITEITKKSDRLKNNFMKRVQNETNVSLKKLSIHVEIFIRSIINHSEASVKNTEPFKQIKQEIANIQAKVSSALKISYFDINKIIEESIEINLRHALLKAITIQTNLNPTILSIQADELKIKQIMVSLLAQTIIDSPEHTTIEVLSNLVNNDNSTDLQIIIKDQSFGLKEEELKQIRKNLGYSDEGYIFGIPILELDDIKKIIDMHQGTFTIESKLTQGRITTITIPCWFSKNQNF